jgi:hypothetical protein
MKLLFDGGQNLQRLVRLSLVALLVFGLGLMPGSASAATTTSTTTTAPVAGQIVVHPTPLATVASLNARYNTVTLFQFTDSPAALVKTADLNGTLAAMAKDANVAWFEANNTARQPAAKDGGDNDACGTSAVAAPTTGAVAKDGGDNTYCIQPVTNGAAAYADQWADLKINLGLAQQRSTGSGVTIAVLDTKVETHPALTDKVLTGIDLISLDPSTNVATIGSKRGHGTFVAGVALHVAPAAKVLPVRVLNDDGRGSTALIAEGIRRAAKAGAKVINLSLSTPTPSRSLQEAVTYAQARGAILVAAYGNEGIKDPAVYPADFTNVISVVATDRNDVLATFTNLGRKADVAAPGVNIVGPWRDGQYGLGSGTSYAAPIVAGEVAMMLSLGLVNNQAAAHARLIQRVDNIDSVNRMMLGFGRVNLQSALLTTTYTSTMSTSTTSTTWNTTRSR